MLITFETTDDPQEVYTMVFHLDSDPKVADRVRIIAYCISPFSDPFIRAGVSFRVLATDASPADPADGTIVTVINEEEFRRLQASIAPLL
ncbi:hypothetical protein R5W23_004497 [Gemmata sp. JC673]|uniref:Uncharacterized protein n=1 Tax=Gemmata algarum TaxID=2975278 RepID=A0ABU5F750_9BACT|nr:hypothetical protein [Gemmata algarum]MDY3563014.1 hypothetical protein [Gemmata algarum]